MAKNKINIVNSKKIKNSSKKIEYYYPEGYNKNNISINPYAPKKLTSEQMGQAQFDEVRGCSCQYSMFWTNYYCYGSTCQNGGAQCWNNSAACSERPPDPKNKMFSQSHRGAGNSSSDKSIRQSHNLNGNFNQIINQVYGLQFQRYSNPQNIQTKASIKQDYDSYFNAIWEDWARVGNGGDDTMGHFFCTGCNSTNDPGMCGGGGCLSCNGSSLNFNGGGGNVDYNINYNFNGSVSCNLSITF